MLLGIAEDTTPALMGLDARSALARLEQRHPELADALGWFIDQQRSDEAMRMAIALAAFWRVSKRLAEGLAWCERALDCPGPEDVRRGRLSYEAGMVAFWMGNDGRAFTLIQQGLAIGRQ